MEKINTDNNIVYKFNPQIYPIKLWIYIGADMLRFIIEASSNPDSIVMDCFCGSGSTLFAADNCSRKWIGIDNSDVAIRITKGRFSPFKVFRMLRK